jgi:hypothetical protein
LSGVSSGGLNVLSGVSSGSLNVRSCGVLSRCLNVLSLNWSLDVLNWSLDVVDSGLSDHWLLDDGGNWLLLHILDSVFNHWLVNNLAFHCLVLSSFLNSLDWDGFVNDFLLWNVFNDFFLNDVGDVLSDVFDGIVVGDFLFTRNDFSSLDGLVFSD